MQPKTLIARRHRHAWLCGILAPCLMIICGESIALAQRDLTDIPEPDPTSEMAAMSLDESASVNLYAGDPAIRKPIQMNFDCTGALWVASSEVYPQIKPGEIANDKIIVLRDTNHDGVHDQHTVFADGLLIPTGVVPDGPHAAYVADSTQLVYLRDTDGDGRADERNVIFSGFGTEDTHHLVHTLRWGPDGCLYFNQSIYIHSHIDTAYGTRHLDGGGIWRYRPTTGRLEVFCKGFINPWGHVFDQFGESFVTDGAYFEGINYTFPDAVFVTSPGAQRWLKGLNPGSPKHCGTEILSGTHIPPSWSGDLVANDFRSHRVCRFTVRPAGSSYQSRQQPEIITTSHVAFRPIDARMGPDGALYIADWYNPIIQHGEVDFRDDRRDRKHGRIWRVSFPNRELDLWPDFQTASVSELVDMLEDPALPVRQFARQQLWNRADTEGESIRRVMQDWADRRDAPNDNTRTLELLWMDEVFGDVRPNHLAMIDLKAESPVTRTAMRSAWRNRHNIAADDTSSSAIIKTMLEQTDHPDPRVRLESVVMNGQRNDDDSAAENLIKAISADRDDPLDFAIWQSVRKQTDALVGLSESGQIDWTGRETELAYVVSAIGTPAAAEIAIGQIGKTESDPETAEPLIKAAADAGNADQLGRLLDTILARPQNESFGDAIAPLIQRTKRDGLIPQDAGPRLRDAIQDKSVLLANPDWSAQIASAAAQWKTNELDHDFADVIGDAPATLRSQLIVALGSFDTPHAKQTVSELANSSDPTVRVDAIRAMATTQPTAAAGPIIKLLSDSSTADAGVDLFVDSLRRKGAPFQLAKRLAKTPLQSDIARVLLRRIKTAGGNPTLETAVIKAGQLDDVSWKLTPQLSSRILSAAKSSGSAERGEAIYRRADLQCILCHAIGPAGGIVGPNLISLGGSSQPDYILESLLDPNAKLKEGYSSISVLTEDGDLINGISVGKSDDFLTLRLADGKEKSIAIDSIEIQKPGKSLMPAGMLDQLTENELVDLVAFLSQLGRTPAYTVSTEPVVRTVETLIYSPEANRRLNRTSTDTVASDDPLMKWRPLTSRVDGRLTIDEMDPFRQHKSTPPTSFLRVHVSSANAGAAGIEFPTDGIECWVDGKPTPNWELKDRILQAGDHTIVLAIDRTVQETPFKIRHGDVFSPTTK
tara:strand:- start:163012 stop:166497 length:3486 start_codon:yes stop_codon:yes gene_type:complete